MNPSLPTETRLLGCTPGEYQQLLDQARREADRLHTEAIGAALDWVLARLRPRPEHRPARVGMQPCQP
jgi:hypothetical protein